MQINKTLEIIEDGKRLFVACEGDEWGQKVYIALPSGECRDYSNPTEEQVDMIAESLTALGFENLPEIRTMLTDGYPY